MPAKVISFINLKGGGELPPTLLTYITVFQVL